MRSAIRLSALLCIVAAAGGSAGAATYRSPDGSIVLEAAQISYSPGKVTGSGKVHVTSTDKAAGTNLEADASKIVVTFASPLSGKRGLGVGLIKEAQLAGPVRLVYAANQPGGVRTATTATCDGATFSGAQQLAHLDGNVRIVHDDPSLFDQPAVMTGDKATVNLKSVLGPDEVRFRIESSPGASRIELTPKPKAAETK